MKTDQQNKTNLTPLPIDSEDSQIYTIKTHAAGPTGSLPLDEEYLLNSPSGDVFGLPYWTLGSGAVDGGSGPRIQPARCNPIRGLCHRSL